MSQRQIHVVEREQDDGIADVVGMMLEAWLRDTPSFSELQDRADVPSTRAPRARPGNQWGAEDARSSSEFSNW
jgi:hypothetical protein